MWANPFMGGILMTKEMLKQAREWTLEAGHMIRSEMHKSLTISTKNDPNDLVTSLDQEVEKFFLKKIKDLYPEHKLYSEEGYGDEVTSLEGIVWIVDPIDGTMNFVHQKENFCISVGIYQDGVGEIGVIYDVIRDNLYIAERNKGAFKNDKKLKPLREDLSIKESILGMNHFFLCENKAIDYKNSQSLVKKVRGVRSYGSAALQFAYVAEGKLDGSLHLSLSPWDLAAGIVLVKEVGGITTNLKGEALSLLDRDSLLTSNKSIHKEIKEELK